jgi:uncharacterized membrane protein YeaQ/YmgE (transglycosylase-associated protein family)
MPVIAWVIMGLLVGLVATQLVEHHRWRWLVQPALGIVGALLGGAFVAMWSGANVTGLEASSRFLSHTLA